MTSPPNSAFKYSVVRHEPQAAAQLPLTGEHMADWYVFGYAATPLGRFYSLMAAEAFAKWYDNLCEGLGGVPPAKSPAPSDFANANALCLVEWSRGGRIDGLVTEQVDALIKNPPGPASEKAQHTSKPS